MTEHVAAKILKLVGDELKKYYIELFKDQENVRLLMDWETFENIWREASENAVSNLPSYPQFSYDDCGEIYDLVGTRYDILTDFTIPNDKTTPHQVVSLAIAVYQVLIANEIEDDEGQLSNSYHESLKIFYPSLKEADASKIYNDYFGKKSDYNSRQEQLWQKVSELFKQLGKSFNIQNLDGQRFVKYPLSQRIIDNKEIRRICNNDFGDVEYPEFSKLIDKFGNYDDDKKKLLFRAYKIHRENSQRNAFWVNKNSRHNNENLVFRCYYDDNSGKFNICDNEGNEVFFSEIEGKRLYSKFDYFVSVKDCKPEEIEEVGKVIPKSELKIYMNSEPTPSNFDCFDSNYKFIVYETSDIKGTHVYNKFFRNAPEKGDNLYELIGGLLLDGRSNTYQVDFPPKIKFNFQCDFVKLNDEDVWIEDSNVLNLAKYKDVFKNSNELLLSIPLDDSESKAKNSVTLLKIKFVKDWPGVNKDSVVKGWNLEYLEPAKSDDGTRLVGFNLKSLEISKVKQNFVPVEKQHEIKKDLEIDTKDFFVKNKYIDCSYIGKFNFSLIIQKEQKKFRYELRKRIKDKDCRRVYELFKTIGNKIMPDEELTFDHWMYFYRLLKREVFESYRDRIYEGKMLVLYYGKALKPSDDKKASETYVEQDALEPYIETIDYVEGLYAESNQKDYFKSLTINGWRPLSDTKMYVQLRNKNSLPMILKSLCRNVNFDCEIATPVIDYLEYFEIFRNLPIEKIETESTAKYTFYFKKEKIAEKSNFYKIIFDSYRLVSDKDTKQTVPRDRTSPIWRGQILLYDYIQLKGIVTWDQIRKFVSEQIPGTDVFSLFFPLYYFGLIEVCHTDNGETRYFATNVNLKVRNPESSNKLLTIKIGRKDFSNRDDVLDIKSYEEDDLYIMEEFEKKALKILKPIKPIEEIVKNHWRKETDLTTFDNLKFVWDFEKNKDGYSPKNDKTFGLMCKSNKKVDLARIGAYFVFSKTEIYKLPSRVENPNAERLAKIIQRAENSDSRMIYNRKDGTLTCKFYDLPIPILRSLMFFDQLCFSKIDKFENIKQTQQNEFTITENIYKEIKRIFPKNYITEE